jgi:hypothetical protein
MIFKTTDEIIKDLALRFKKIRKVKKITQEELDAINTIDFSDSTELFYCIPLLIYCLERRIEDALK